MDKLAQSPQSSSDDATPLLDDNLSDHDQFPVIGVFWDIENCQIPRGRSAVAVAQRIREKFFARHREVEFLVVCDVTKENPKIIDELNYAKVNVIHVAATSKNAADDKLRQRIRHFGETYSPGSTLVLMTGDINFSSELIEIRHRRMMRVILLHNQNTSESLIISANCHYIFHDLIENVQDRDESSEESMQVDLWIHNLPENEPANRIKTRLRQLCSNCGGRVFFHSRNVYYIRFTTIELATRAQRRMDGQDVFGRRIAVSEPRGFDWSRTPGRNRPKQQEELLKPWDTLLDVNTHTPQGDAKIAGIESLRHLNTMQQQQLHNNLRKAGIQAAASVNLSCRLNNVCDSKSKGEYLTDSSSGPCDEDSDGEKSGAGCETGPVDLRVTGLDAQQDLHSTRVQLADAINQYAKIANLSVFTQTDGSVVATVQLKCLSDAQLVIANLQRFRFGNQRIKIAFHNTTPEQRQLIRRQVSELLIKFPESKIPLFRFKELYKNEYLTSVSVSELRRMRDICIISEDDSGRTISANPWSRGSPYLQQSFGDWQEGAFCEQHYRSRPGYMTEPAGLPSVRIRLGLISERVQYLLQSHKGRLPLASLEHCYTSRFGPMPISHEDGVALEHLVSCLPGIEIVQTQASHKYLTSCNNMDKPMEKGRISVNGGLTSQLLELLKASPRATLSFASFIPAYHRRFGKQFRLSDFGHTKLLDLLESMPHIVQVMGFGSKKQVTLSHRSQMKRFKIDLLKVLKTLPKKNIELNTFPPLYSQVFSRPFEPWQYGLCELEDLISCCIGTDLQLTCMENGCLVVSVTVREQTAEELVLTQRFKAEVVELLKHNPDCSIPFNKFVPAYHNYFGKQCRVASYGFHKLIDLFEAITDTATVEESSTSDEKHLVLTLSERLKVLGERVNQVASAHGGIMLADLEHTYQLFQYGVIDPVQFECDSLIQLIGLLSDYVKVVPSPHGYLLHAAQPLDAIALDLRTRYLLLSRDRLSVDAFRAFYVATFPGHDLNVDLAISRIPQTARITAIDDIRHVQLTPRAVFANQVYNILFENGGRIPLVNFESLFSRRFGTPVRPTELGSNNLSGLLSGFPETFSIQTGQPPTQSILQLNPSIKESGFSLPLPPNQTYSLWEQQPLFSNIARINPPSPSCLPMPDGLLAIKRKLTT